MLSGTKCYSMYSLSMKREEECIPGRRVACVPGGLCVGPRIARRVVEVWLLFISSHSLDHKDNI